MTDEAYVLVSFAVGIGLLEVVYPGNRARWPGVALVLGALATMVALKVSR